MDDEFYTFIIVAIILFCTTLSASLCASANDADDDCRELIIVCGDKSLASGECIRDAKVVLTMPPEVRFTRCDWTKGTIELEGGDCWIMQGKSCE